MTASTHPSTANRAPTLRIDVGGTRFAYRKDGPGSGVPVIHHRPSGSQVLNLKGLNACPDPGTAAAPNTLTKSHPHVNAHAGR